MKENYGFVYIWYDRKHKKYYIGCRWGNENDGYICSSSWMKQGYKHRPQDFKRRILTKIYTNKKDLLKEEYRWLSKIKNEELGKKYYNIHNHHFNHWSTDEYQKEKTIKKIKGNKNRLGKTKSKEEIEKIKKSLTGRKRSLESRIKQSKHLLGYKQSKEHIKNKANANKGKKRKIVICPNCKKTGGINAMRMWHFDKCSILKAAY